MSCDATSSKRGAGCSPRPTLPLLQYVAVMRHTVREDERKDDWVVTACRPWDPPISKEGVGLVSHFQFLCFLLGFLLHL